MNFYTINLENFMTVGLLIFGIVIVLYAQFKINYNYSKYKKIKNSKVITGMEVARLILDANDLNDIYIVETNGELSDHYDPRRKVIRLSKDIYNGDSIAAISVAAHECGHAIQHKENYFFMKIRTILVPVVNLVSYLGYFGIIVGILSGMTGYLLIGIITLLATILFQLVTLPVEIDASARAREQLNNLNITISEESDDVKRMLNAAAMTYIASLISSLAQLLRLIIMFREDDK